MTPPEIPIGKRVQLVREAIARIEKAEESIRVKGWSLSRSADLLHAETDFAQQRNNVKAILEDLCPTP